MLETTDEGGVADLLERARQAVKALGVEPAGGRRLSASIGWAVFPHDADDRAELIALADARALPRQGDRPRPRDAVGDPGSPRLTAKPSQSAGSALADA